METREQLLVDKQVTETVINHCIDFEAIMISFYKDNPEITVSEEDKELMEILQTLHREAKDIKEELTNMLK